MRTSTGVDTAGPHHKYSSPMACYLDSLAHDGVADETCGDVDSIGCFARFGRHMISENELGFVVHHRFLTTEWAQAMFRALDQLDGEWYEDAEPDQLDVIALHRNYAFYVYQSAKLAEEHTERFGWCQFDQEDLYSYDEWLFIHQPTVHSNRR